MEKANHYVDSLKSSHRKPEEKSGMPELETWESWVGSMETVFQPWHHYHPEELGSLGVTSEGRTHTEGYNVLRSRHSPM